MTIELKKEIITYILENLSEFQLINATVDHFRQYIYTENGYYLLGGQEVSDFISDACKLLSG